MEDDVKQVTRSHAALISRVQEDLRAKCHQQPENAEKIWTSHCENAEVLKQYAESMEFLAQFGWQSWLGQSSGECRIAWCRNFYRSFFLDGRSQWEEKLTMRDKKLARRYSLAMCDEQKIPVTGCGKVRLLDVGSCYNPFRVFDDTVAFGIDLAPAPNRDVAKCDFLDVPTVENLETGWSLEPSTNSVLELSSNYFDVVVLSLVLNYLPTPSMRLRCCQRAYEVLRQNGLLLIVSPDSKRRGKNDQLVKSWKIALGFVGFHCLVQEKMTHLHAMAFRKNDFLALEQREAEKLLAVFEAKSNRKCVLSDMMFIPQDFRVADDVNSNSDIEGFDGPGKVEGFLELPLFDCSDGE